jgi:hypothetical protein
VRNLPGVGKRNRLVDSFYGKFVTREVRAPIICDVPICGLGVGGEGERLEDVKILEEDVP